MLDVTAMTDGELTAFMAAVNREIGQRRTSAAVPRQLEAALTAAEEAGVEDLDGLITAARGRVRRNPNNAPRGRKP